MKLQELIDVLDPEKMIVNKRYNAWKRDYQIELKSWRLRISD